MLKSIYQNMSDAAEVYETIYIVIWNHKADPLLDCFHILDMHEILRGTQVLLNFHHVLSASIQRNPVLIPIWIRQI